MIARAAAGRRQQSVPQACRSPPRPGRRAGQSCRSCQTRSIDMPTALFPVREILPNGVYPASLLGMEDQQATDGGVYWKWTFSVSYEGRIVERTATSSTNFSPKAK